MLITAYLIHLVNHVITPISDEELMRAYSEGDSRAFETLYKRHRNSLYHYIMRQLQNEALADEIFQDIWQRVITAHNNWQPTAQFKTWLFTIAHNRLNDYWRAQKHRPNTPMDAEERIQQMSDHRTPEHLLSEFEQAHSLKRALDLLPDEQKHVIQLRLELELSLQEIGEITGVSRETVKSRLRYALDKLRAGLTA